MGDRHNVDSLNESGQTRRLLEVRQDLGVQTIRESCETGCVIPNTLNETKRVMPKLHFKSFIIKAKNRQK